MALLLVFSLAACTSTTESTKETETTEVTEATVDPQSEVLSIVQDGNVVKAYSVDELKALGTETYNYSGRSKKNDGARVIKTYEGVKLETILKDAGIDAAGCTLTCIAADGYTKEFAFDDINTLYAFADETSTDKTEVPAIIAIGEAKDDAEYPSVFQIVFGQADYDSEESADFNMTSWVSYLVNIEVQ